MSETQDQKFFDLFTLVVGILIAITFVLFVVARIAGTKTQRVWVQQDVDYQEQVEQRIAPVGHVRLPGEESRPAATPQVAVAEPVAAPMSGPQVYNAACVACHGAGIGGAPRIGDKQAWAPRIAQGRDVLSTHVLNGYTGNSGYMPPKGGRVDLADEEILAAMSYILDQSS